MKDVEMRLFSMQDLKYRDFQSKLMPDCDKERVIGVRTPVLRKYAREFSKDPRAKEFLLELPHKYYEENNLHAYLIGILAKDFDQTLQLTEEFLPYIDNWATCDTFSPKGLKKDPGRLYEKTIQWMASRHVYTVRYGIVTQLQYFLDDWSRPEMLEIIASLHREEYYINMAAAWYYSVALVKQYETTLPLFTEKRLDKWLHNKSLQKAIESYRIDKEKKDYLRSLRVK